MPIALRKIDWHLFWICTERSEMKCKASYSCKQPFSLLIMMATDDNDGDEDSG